MTAQAREQREPDWGAGPILEAAALLEVKEFDLFALAHRWWFGRRMNPDRLERVFAAYMFGGAVPPWVRHYAREILRECRSGSPDLARFGLARPRPEAPPRHGRLIVAATLAVFFVLYILILQTVAEPDRWTTALRGEAALSCQGGGPGLKFIESLAHGIAGRAPPSCPDPD